MDDSNYVTVENHSNVGVTVNCSLSGIHAGVTGSVDGSGLSVDKVLEACAVGGASPEHTFYVTFTAEDSFSPSEYNGTLARVTVSVSAAQ